MPEDQGFMERAAKSCRLFYSLRLQVRVTNSPSPCTFLSKILDWVNNISFLQDDDSRPSSRNFLNNLLGKKEITER